MEQTNNIFQHANDTFDQLAAAAKKHVEETETAIDELAEIEPEINKEPLNNLKSALKRMEADLAQPLIRIAAIGTTSSAKSSLLNFLAGAPLLPTGVQEKSAGSVRIIHSPEISLHIEETENAQWPCGDIEVQNSRDIVNRLDEVMETYKAAVNAGTELEAPAIIITYPIYLAQLLNLPAGYQLELMDLPGLKYTGDERNLRVMRQCADALCLVALGSQETDPLRQEALVEEALDQVQTIGSPIARMLFVITRVDEFLLRNAEDWPDNEDEYVEERVNAILEKLAAQMPENPPQKIASARISPMPALYSLDLSNPEKRTDAYKHVQHSYYGLVIGGRNRDSEDGIDPAVDLSSPKYKMWTDEDWKLVAAQLNETSGADNFLKTLEDHIADNILEITLPPIKDRYKTAAEESARELKDWIRALRIGINQNFEEESKRLTNSGQTLVEINAEAKQRLDAFLKHWTDLFQQEQQNRNLNDWLLETKQKFPEFVMEDYAVLGKWATKLYEAYLKPVKSVSERIRTGATLPPSLPHRTELEKAILQLKRLGYDKAEAQSGKKFSSSVYGQIQNLEEAFTRLNKLCSRSSKDCIQGEFARQTDKVLTAMDKLQNAYLELLAAKIDAIPPEFQHIFKITPQALKKFTLKNSPDSKDIHFKIAKNIRKFKESKTFENLSNTGWKAVDFVVNQIRHLTGRDKITRDVEKTEYSIELPSLEKLQKDVFANFSRQFPELQKYMFKSVEGQVKEFLSNIDKCQQSRIEEYQNKLQEMMKEKRVIAADKQITLNNVLKKVEKLEQPF